jgi:hypothetical protein
VRDFAEFQARLTWLTRPPISHASVKWFKNGRFPHCNTAEEFGGEAFSDLGEVPNDVTIVVSTVPASAGLTLPANLLRPEVCRPS